MINIGDIVQCIDTTFLFTDEVMLTLGTIYRVHDIRFLGDSAGAVILVDGNNQWWHVSRFSKDHSSEYDLIFLNENMVKEKVIAKSDADAITQAFGIINGHCVAWALFHANTIVAQYPPKEIQ